MNKGLCVMAFVVGAAAGSFATWQLLKKKYEAIAQEEIDSVKELYSQDVFEEETLVEEESEAEEEKTKEVAKKATEKPNIMEYSEKIKKYGYSEGIEANNHGFEEITPHASFTSCEPYVIAPEEFGADEDYEKINLTYYSDGVLVDENDEVVDDVDAKIGIASLDTFGRYEDDSVHVKNDTMKCYYEILKDERNYEDVMAEKQPTYYYE